LLKTHRLWEYYLIHRAKLQPDHVHRDADQIEHILPLDIINNLEQLLQSEGIDIDKLGSIHPLH
jgi:manganese/zinc/iron transport system permease protein